MTATYGLDPQPFWGLIGGVGLEESLSKITMSGSGVVCKLKSYLAKVKASRPGYNDIAIGLGTEFRMRMRARAAPLQIISADAVVTPREDEEAGVMYMIPRPRQSILGQRQQTLHQVARTWSFSVEM